MLIFPHEATVLISLSACEMSTAKYMHMYIHMYVHVHVYVNSYV